MKFNDILMQKRAAILDHWRNSIVESYPANTSKFLNGERDRFHNPVGDTMRRDTEIIIDHLLSNKRFNESHQFPQGLIKIRAVQDFSAAEAVSFIFDLKKVVREELRTDMEQFLPDFLELETRIDELALVAFDAYMKSRETIHEIKIGEIKRISRMALRASGPEDDNSNKVQKEN
jgi:hypothetical protein